MLKRLLLMMVMMTLVACGGGGAKLNGDNSSDDNTSLENTQGFDGDSSGDEFGDLSRCVNINSWSSRFNFVLKTVAYIDNQAATEQRLSVDVIAIGDRSSTVKVTTTDNSNVLSSRSEFYLANNYKHITSSFNEYENNRGEVFLTQAIYSNPYHRFPSGTVCEDQSWEDTYVDRRDTSEYGLQLPEQRSTVTVKGTVEGINVLKTVAVGEFNTYIIKFKGATTAQLFWLDIETGVEVYSEQWLNGSLLSTSELVELNN